jgi:hypothetical protein
MGMRYSIALGKDALINTVIKANTDINLLTFPTKLIAVSSFLN